MTIADGFAAAIAALLLMSNTGAQIAQEEEDKLKTCLDMAETQPAEAYEYGLAWLSEGSRPYARYCTARALIELGNLAEGAARLEALANAPDAGSLDKRIVYLAQSGNAWLAAGLPEEAILVLNSAIQLSAHDYELYIDRARAHLMTERWAEGEADLTQALAAQPGSLDGYFLRAQARLNQELYEAAMRDVENAIAIDPENIDVLVLRGDIREEMRLKGLR